MLRGSGPSEVGCDGIDRLINRQKFTKLEKNGELKQIPPELLADTLVHCHRQPLSGRNSATSVYRFLPNSTVGHLGQDDCFSHIQPPAASRRIISRLSTESDSEERNTGHRLRKSITNRFREDIFRLLRRADGRRLREIELITKYKVECSPTLHQFFGRLSFVDLLQEISGLHLERDRNTAEWIVSLAEDSLKTGACSSDLQIRSNFPISTNINSHQNDQTPFRSYESPSTATTTTSPALESHHKESPPPPLPEIPLRSPSSSTNNDRGGAWSGLDRKLSSSSVSGVRGASVSPSAGSSASYRSACSEITSSKPSSASRPTYGEKAKSANVDTKALATNCSDNDRKSKSKCKMDGKLESPTEGLVDIRMKTTKSRQRTRQRIPVCRQASNPPPPGSAEVAPTADSPLPPDGDLTGDDEGCQRENKDTSTEAADRKPDGFDGLRSKIKTLLDRYVDGVTVGIFEFAFKKEYKHPLDFTQYDFVNNQNGYGFLRDSGDLQTYLGSSDRITKLKPVIREPETEAADLDVETSENDDDLNRWISKLNYFEDDQDGGDEGVENIFNSSDESPSNVPSVSGDDWLNHLAAKGNLEDAFAVHQSFLAERMQLLERLRELDEKDCRLLEKFPTLKLSAT